MQNINLFSLNNLNKINFNNYKNLKMNVFHLLDKKNPSGIELGKLGSKVAHLIYWTIESLAESHYKRFNNVWLINIRGNSLHSCKSLETVS